MLVLTRKPGESILFPTIPISVKVVKQKGKGVSLGIDAPEEVIVVRDNTQRAIEHDPSETMIDELKRLRSLQSSAQAGFGAINAMTQRIIDSLVAGKPSNEVLNDLRNIQSVIDTFETTFNGTGCEIAVVGSNKNERELLGSVLEMMGYRVRSLATIEDAVKYLHVESPDAIIVDIGEQDCGVCDEITKAAGDSKVIVVCTEVPNQDLDSIDVAVEKPIDVTEIKDAIDA